MTESRPWLRGVVWLLFLGPFFFASYGFANWLASRRDDVGSIVFAWEAAIPFVPWTIIPYWSIDLLYVVSLFVWATRREVDRHAWRLLAVQIVAIAFFIAFPLMFSFDRPEADGIYGALFTALGSFDKPFNQAPSLHIALLVLIWVALAQRLKGAWRWLLHGWMTLIGLSILTTYQHHFIDLPTGVAAGAAVLWALPAHGPSPLSGLAPPRDRRRWKLAALYITGSVVCAGLALLGGTWLWLFWPALSLALVAAIYAPIGERGFQKGSDGRLSVGSRILLAPYLVAAWINSRLWTWRHPQPSEVVDGVWVGRIPMRVDRTFGAVVDLTAELSCNPSQVSYYKAVPSLDLVIPAAATLKEAATAIEEGRSHGPVLVCCALGYSRSAAATAAWLLMTERAESAEAAMEMVRKVRPSIVLRGEHGAALEALA